MAFKGSNRTVLAIISGLFAATAMTGTGILVQPDAHSAWAGSRDARSVCQTSVLVADDGLPGDLLGYSVAIGDDYAFLGDLSGDTDTVFDCGTVYGFRRDGVAWVQYAELNGSDAILDDKSGTCVSVSGDVSIVGASKGPAPNVPNAGAAHFFTRDYSGLPSDPSGAFWVQEAKLLVGGFYDESNAHLGAAVAVDGDRAIVGASDDPKDIDGGETVRTSAVYSFERIPEICGSSNSGASAGRPGARSLLRLSRRSATAMSSASRWGSAGTGPSPGHGTPEITKGLRIAPMDRRCLGCTSEADGH